MSMSRKDYIRFAEELRDTRPYDPDTPEYRTWSDCVEAVVRVCKGDNYRFQSDHFWRVCEGKARANSRPGS